MQYSISDPEPQLDCFLSEEKVKEIIAACKYLTFSTLCTVLHAISNLLPTVAAKHFLDDLTDGGDGRKMASC